MEKAPSKFSFLGDGQQQGREPKAGSTASDAPVQSLPRLGWKIDFEGHPVTATVVTIDIPGETRLQDCSANVNVSVFEVLVELSGHTPLSVNLPLAATPEDCTAQLLEDTHALVVRLPLRRFTNVLKEVCLL